LPFLPLYAGIPLVVLKFRKVFCWTFAGQ
jgi:hypothetical protein